MFEYYSKRKNEEEEKGNRYTQEDFAKELGVGASLVSHIKLGKKMLSFKTADLIEKNTQGRLKADKILEQSIEWHKKWLERRAKFQKNG